MHHYITNQLIIRQTHIRGIHKSTKNLISNSNTLTDSNQLNILTTHVMY